MSCSECADVHIALNIYLMYIASHIVTFTQISCQQIDLCLMENRKNWAKDT